MQRVGIYIDTTKNYKLLVVGLVVLVLVLLGESMSTLLLFQAFDVKIYLN